MYMLYVIVHECARTYIYITFFLENEKKNGEKLVEMKCLGNFIALIIFFKKYV